MKKIYNYIDYYKNPYYPKQPNLYTLQNTYESQKVNISENNLDNTGFLRLSIIDTVSEVPVSNATITVYVNDGIQKDVPIMHLITTLNPVTIELPMANELGTLIIGPEYDFSTYNLRVDAFGYFSTVIYNIRLFPNTTTNFDITMIPISQLEMEHIIEERFDIPPHPRDELV